MSFSVDDLVSSLSQSHIGEEANDIAVLQVIDFQLNRQTSLI